MPDPSGRSSRPMNSPIGPNQNLPTPDPEKSAMPPVLLDSSFLIDLEREIAAGVAGPAIKWLRQSRGIEHAH